MRQNKEKPKVLWPNSKLRCEIIPHMISIGEELLYSDDARVLSAWLKDAADYMERVE